MIDFTKALILSYLKYGDNSIILKCFTREFGFKSFILKGAFSSKNKKSHYLLSLNEVEISFYPKKTHSLELIKSIHQGHLFKTIHSDIIKSSILTFVVEILNQSLKNEEIQDFILYEFIKNSLIQFDEKTEHFVDFHLYFLLQLTRYIGFFPLYENSNLPYFNLREGVFASKSQNISTGENSLLWNKLLQYDFDKGLNCFSASQRKQMLEEMISFYELHLTNFKKPLSLEVLKVLF